MNTFLELLITIGRFLVGLWPLMFLAILAGIFKRKKGFGAMLRTSINALMISWAFFALLNLVFYFFKMDTFHLLPENVNLKYFLSVGLILLPFEVAILLEERYKKIDASTLKEMQALSPANFERLVAETYRAQGHKVEIIGATGDHGIDLVVNTRKGETWLVQCKKYRGKVGEPVIRDFYGALRAANADAGAVVTTGTITTQARLWAEGKPIFLYDGLEFLDVIKTTRIRKSLPAEARKKTTVNPFSNNSSLQPAYASTAASTISEVQPVISSTKISTESDAILATEPEDIRSNSSEEPDAYPQPDKRPFMNMEEVPVCPACGLPMLLYTEKQLLSKPKKMYICQNAPSCEETIEVE